MNNKPNIVYILVDDMGIGDLSCFNPHSKINTPCVDKMASEGMMFCDAHSSSAVCTPSRYSILTGRYNFRSHLKNGVLGGYSPALIEQGRITVASMLKEMNYATACIGKWHLGLDWAKHNDSDEIDYSRPIENGVNTHGFDYFFGIPASLDMAPYVYIENDRVTSLPDRETESEGLQFWRKGPTAPDFKHAEVLPKLTCKALDFIEKNKNDSFFLYFPMPAPHLPVLPTCEFIGKSSAGSYGDFVLMCDDVVGKITKKLDELGLSDNTIVIFASDNGFAPAAQPKELLKLGHNPSYVYRGYKADIYEGGHRIPLVVKWQGKVQSGIKSDEPICLIDLFATIADITGYKIPDNAAEDSVSNLPVWQGLHMDKPLREAIVHHSIDGSFSIRKGIWKLELCPGSGGWSYPKPGEEPSGSPEIQLYNLDTDIGEKDNVYDKYPDVVAELKGILSVYIENGRSVPVRS